MTGTNSDDIHTYRYGGFDISSEDNNSSGLAFKADGSKMYISGFSTPDSIYEYNLSTAWDVNTASYSQSLDVSTNADGPADVFFKSDGTRMYILNQGIVISNRKVVEYSLSTAWDVSTGSYVQNFGVGSQVAAAAGMYLSDDGTKMYVACVTNDAVYEYDLSTAWDVSTASYNQSFDISSEELNVDNIVFGDNGTKMYIVSDSGDDVTQYDLSTAWDISTASYNQQYYSPVGINPHSIYFKDDGTQFFVADSVNDKVFAFSISDE
jgi:sugar lactone lactonase YvrE